MPEINITVDNKIAIKADETEYICSNSDFVVNFNFDSEWEAYETKTARFSHNGGYIDVVFSGSQCAVPIIKDTYCFFVGVYAGNLHTTTPARVPCKLSILCGSSAPAAPTDDVYNQIMERLNELGTTDPEAIAAAVAEYIAQNPIAETDPTVPEWAKAAKKPSYTADEVGAVAKTELQTAVDTALAQAKASGAFDGAAGKSAYQYAQDGGYTGTETEFAEKLAQEQLTGTTGTLTPKQVYDAVSAGIPVKVQHTNGTYGILSFTAFNIAESLSIIVSQAIVYYNSVYILAELGGNIQAGNWFTNFTVLAEKADIPSTLPNPNSITFTGAVTGSYDGSAPLSVNIPTVPTKTSQLTNDSGYLTLATLPKYGGESE